MLHIAEREISGVTFDLEGTVVDLEPYHFAAHVETAKQVGVFLDLDNPRTFTKIVPHFIGGPQDEIMQEILNLAKHQRTWIPTQSETEEAKLKALGISDREAFINLRAALTEIPPRVGFLEFLAQLRATGIPVAIGSLTERKEAEIILKKSGLDRLIDTGLIVLKEDVKRVKPNPEVYIKTAEHLGINTYNQLVFEDSHNGVTAGREAGSLVIGMPTILQPQVLKRLKEAGAIHIFTDWREVNLQSIQAIESIRPNTP